MKRVVLTCLALALYTGSSRAWWPRGHGILTRAAIQALPDDAPVFLKAGAGMIAHVSVDPDIAKNRGTPHLEKAGHPTHYFNVELLEGRDLPASRYEYDRLCAELGKKTEQIGLLPYVTAEWTEQLALALAEYRKWPENPYVQNKCLVYAGILAHYAQEVCQPLNLTVHWNGRAVDGKAPRSRLHETMDSAVQELALNPHWLSEGVQPAALDSLMGGVVAQIDAGHRRVEVALGFADKLAQRDWENDPGVRVFVEAQAREAVRFTAALYLTAWKMSEAIRLPGWIDRKEMDHFGVSK